MKQTSASTNESVYQSFEELERDLFPLSTARRSKKPTQGTGFAAEFLRKLQAELHPSSVKHQKQSVKQRAQPTCGG